MSGKSVHLSNTSVDADDAPALTDDFFANGTYVVDDKPVTAKQGKAAMRKARGRPVVANKKQTITIRLAPEVIARWRASGKGWQTRASELLEKNAP